jgi:hypothetical protein
VTTATLLRRLDKIAGPWEGTTRFIPDWSVLTAEQQDRYCELVELAAGETATPAELIEWYGLISLCPPMGPKGRQEPPISVPGSLGLYLRRARINGSLGPLPRGNYSFGCLGFADCERLTQLCMKYGWDPDDDQIEIAAFYDWIDDDYTELCDLLGRSVSLLEPRRSENP